MLYERLFRAHPDLQMIVDEHGGQEFQESLKSYVSERFVDDLFGDKDAFQTMASKDNVLVHVEFGVCGWPFKVSQLADEFFECKSLS